MAFCTLKKDLPRMKAGTEGVSLGPCTFHGVPGYLFFANEPKGEYVFFTHAAKEKWLEKVV